MKISPAYREDTHEGLPADVKAYLDEKFLKTLKNRTLSNPKLLVVFSGGNAVGKSALSQKIATELSGVVIENDEIKRRLMEYKPDIGRTAMGLLTWQYTMDLYQRIGDEIPNGLIVRDAVIDWYYDRILPIFEQQGYGIFVIGYALTEKKLIELVHARGDKQTVTAERLVTILEDHAIHQKRFRSLYTPDVLLDDDTVFDHDMVIEKLRMRLVE